MRAKDHKQGDETGTPPSPGSPEVTRHLAFSDWLRTHEVDRELYGRTKRSLADGKLDDIRSYTDAKDAVIDGIYARAVQK